jgi:Fe-S cluster biogenesis protein NfuA
MEPEIKILGEPSTNGDHCRFTVDRPILPGRSAYFSGPETGGPSALANELLALDGVTSVLIADNLVEVGSEDSLDWPALGIGQIIRKHMRSGAPVVAEDYYEDLPAEEDLKWAIVDLLNREINPAVAAHGGFVELIDVKANNVYIRMGGGCQGCGAANVTLKYGVEKAIRDLVPKVGEILDTTDHASGRNPYYAPAK